ncbi:PA14 domain-containing protein [Pseudoflavitalea rhizosphaerae]|uniref:PA14 domain-containing protein n=1 Tax=Pseudoflavitalea rhizosphaerae TaxID=1884793 RepID=UPI000F8D3FEA|nr:PA14 domain-containing protein [Pseudoflavitalea rhizosphaerae]
MVQTLVRFHKVIAWLFVTLFYLQLILVPVVARAEERRYKPNYAFGKTSPGTFKKAVVKEIATKSFDNEKLTVAEKSTGHKNVSPAIVDERKEKKQKFTIGPTQPEMKSFQSVNSNNLVDLFTGDFSYNIPLLDVGGYPVNLHYQSGITSDQDASWVGLGWNINPGVIVRNMRGLPDDFSGEDDKVGKIVSIKPNKTVGVTGGFDTELAGFPMKVSTNMSVFHNTYKGWGTELGLSASIKAGVGGKGELTGGLGITNNSQSGLDVSPSVGFKLGKEESKMNGNINIGTNFNSRLGIQELQVSGQTRVSLDINKNLRVNLGTGINAGISFAKPSFTPTIHVPYTSSQSSFTFKMGDEKWALHGSLLLRGYMSKQYVAKEDTLLALPAYGYLNYQEAGSNTRVLLDFNREKDVSYSNNSPHIALPIYTYDTWSISGEGTGGMFRAYRGDIGSVFDHSMTTRSNSDRFSVDLGVGSIVHVGVDFDDAYSVTSSYPWISNNAMYDVTRFRKRDTTFENVYFKNPGEKTAVNKEYLDAIGDDNLMRVMLTPAGDAQNEPEAGATRHMALFKNGRKFDTRTISNDVVRKKREKRKQMISYLTAKEARVAGLDKQIKSYFINQFPNGSCDGFNIINRSSEGRRDHHISEVSVLSDDGRRYVYGVPVYNKKQIEVTMSTGEGNNNTGLVDYTPGVDNSTANSRDKDGYFNKEVLPPYAHSYLLSGILSPDYIDLTGDGITEDDQGDAVKFNYSRTFNMDNPYRWRAPFDQNKAFYNEGTKTDNRDERGSYTYGEREVWMLNSIESKTMIATFVLDGNREDAIGVKDENGGGSSSQKLHRLKEINLYAKADWVKNGTSARPIKTVHFAYSYSLCKGAPGTTDPELGKLTLDSVWFTYNKRGRAAKNAYKFNYHTSNPGYDSKMSDRWGNYKNSKNNPGSTGGTLTNADYSYTLQTGNGNWTKDSADVNAASWTLSDIKLPSGGAIKVSYEADDYAYVQNKRAMQFYQVEGFGRDTLVGSRTLNLYSKSEGDYHYAFLRVNEPVSSVDDIRRKYLEGVEKLFFKLMVKMPKGANGLGSEFIPCYAEFDNVYRYANDPTLICVKLRPITGNESPLATAAIQYIRQNHPHLVYPGSETGDNLSLRAILTSMASIVSNVTDAIKGFSKYARDKSFCREIILDKSLVRLNNPDYRKYGGGLRVKKVEVYDNWNQMSTGSKAAKYGQEYDYSTVIEIGGQKKVISSGVASYEPVIGNDENPFRVPFRLYSEQVGALAPADFLYTEEPFAETFFPAPIVGYSKVTVQSIHKTKKSANGITETEFYTTKDFPTVVEITPLDRESKKTYNPRLRNFFKVDAVNYVTISQGFKVELNDMNGKMKSTTSYAQNNLKDAISYTYNYYRLENDNTERKKLSNKVAVVNDASGVIDENAEVGKEVEIMMDIREQMSVSGSASYEVNVDVANLIPPVVIGSSIPFPNKETNRFRSIAVLKVVNRYAILDSVVVIEKGSKVSTRNLVFDGETGDPLVTSTNNMFDDPVYSLNYPAHWAYSGMEAAYKNQGTVLTDISIRRGITYRNGVEVDLSRFFESGDEILLSGWYRSASLASPDPCDPLYYIYEPGLKDSIVWAIHGNKPDIHEKGIYFINRRGFPVTVMVSSMKIVRSGKRNIGTSPVGAITSMASPIRGGRLVVDDTTKVLSAQAVRFKDKWKVEKVLRQYDSCVMETRSGSKDVPFLNYLLKYDSDDHPNHEVHYNNTSLAAVYKRHGTRTFIARSVMALDMSGIPGNATINSALLYLKGRSPVDMFPVGPFTISTLDYNYEGLGEEAKGFIIPFTDNITPGGYVDFKADATLNSDPNKVEVYSRGSVSTCLDYDALEIKSAVQPLVGLNPQQQNLLLKMNTENNTNGSSEVRFMTFYAQPAIQSFAQSVITPFASNCIGAPPPNGCLNRTCPSYLQIQYSYPELTCYKVCRQEYLQGDTLNPYVVGILGNWKVDTSYVYYGDRRESTVATQTNTRTDGLIRDYASYWTFGEKYLTAHPDITRWVWNSKSTLHNKRGLELENKDPLDRYNAAIYGFNKTLPVATAQNARNSEIAFDGFEDQKYQVDKCNECFESGWMKIDSLNGRRTEHVSHSGRNSLEVFVNKKMEMSIPVLASPASDAAGVDFKRDSVMQVKTTVFPNGYGLTAQAGVYSAHPNRNECIGRTITQLEMWPDTYISNLNVDFGYDGPPVFCAKDWFEVHFTGQLLVEETNTYFFDVECDDTLTLIINGVQILKEGRMQNQIIGPVLLHQGFQNIVVKLKEGPTLAKSSIKWARTGNPTFVEIPLVNQYASTEVANNSNAIRKDTTWCIGLTPVKPVNGLTTNFIPVRESKMIVSGWVRENIPCSPETGYINSGINISFPGVAGTSKTIKPSGRVIEGWQRFEEVINVPPGATSMKYELFAGPSGSSYFDDIRVHPYNANMKSYVYDPVNIRLLAELDENNYSTFYEYDDEGTLTRVKKETERGVKTIKETRSALTKKDIQDQTNP